MHCRREPVARDLAFVGFSKMDDPPDENNYLYDSFPGERMQETIIPITSMMQDKSLIDMDTTMLRDLFTTIKDDLNKNISKDHKCVYITYDGEEHSHIHLALLKSLPIILLMEMQDREFFAKEHERCPSCDMVKYEANHKRKIFESDNFIVFCPFASGDWSVKIMPKDHQPAFHMLEDLIEFTEIFYCLQKKLIKITRNKIDWVIKYPNISEYHWEMQLIPHRHESMFERVSGVMIFQVSPEIAAWRLRTATP